MFTPPTRGEKISWAGFYGMIFVAGVFVLVVPPITIEAPLGTWLTPLWGCLLAASLVLILAALLGRYKWEYTTLPLVISGVAMYAVTIWYLTLSTPSRGAQAALITALAFGLGRRWLDRRRWVKRDKQRAQRADPNQDEG